MSVWLVGYFLNNGVGRTGLDPLPTVTVYALSDNSEVLSAEDTTEIGGGGYKYDFTDDYDETEEYWGVMDGGSAIPDCERYCFLVPRITNEQINAEVLDVMNTDTFGEPGQGAPPATASIFAKINYLYKRWRNKYTETSSQANIYNDAGDTIDQKAPLSDDGTTFTEGEYASGP